MFLACYLIIYCPGTVEPPKYGHHRGGKECPYYGGVRITEVAVHGCHCPGSMAAHMRKVLAEPWVGDRLCHFKRLQAFI